MKFKIIVFIVIIIAIFLLLFWETRVSEETPIDAVSKLLKAVNSSTLALILAAFTAIIKLISSLNNDILMAVARSKAETGNKIKDLMDVVNNKIFLYTIVLTVGLVLISIINVFACRHSKKQ